MEEQVIDLRRAAIQQLESLRRAGVRQIPARPKVTADAAPRHSPGAPGADAFPADAEHLGEEPGPPSVPAAPPRPRAAAQPAADLFQAEPAKGPVADKAGELKMLAQQVAACTRCELLAARRTQTVFGVGNPNARLVFFGEAPGADEDRQGEPFVGRAGQLLTDIIVKGLRMRREDVYILNTLKCRPPENRNPQPDELANCRPFWQRQLAIISPEFIVCLGRFAMQELLQTSPTMSVGRMRGRVHTFQEARVIVTYHPSYLLRNPEAKKDVWEDMKLLMREMGIQIDRQ